MTKEEKINAIIDQVKHGMVLMHRYTDTMGYPQPDSLMDDIFNALENRTSMLFAAWLPRLANVREYTGDFIYKHALDYISTRALQELGRPVCSFALVAADASREDFIKALEDWEIKYSLET